MSSQKVVKRDFDDMVRNSLEKELDGVGEIAFITGVEAIDSGHRALLSRLGDLEWAIAARCSKEIVGQFLADFGELALRHFEQEEKVMEAVNYADLDAHRDEHRALIRKLEEYAEAFARDGQSTFAGALVFLEQWTADHLIHADMGYCAYLSPGEAH